MSSEPRIPRDPAVAISCSKLWPASVAWLASRFTFTSFSNPKRFRNPYTVAVSKSYCCERGLLGLRFNEDLPVEADLVFVVDDQRKERAHLIEFLLHVGVQQRLVAFTAAPQHIVRATQTLGRFHAVLHRRRGPRENLRGRICRGARHEARMREEVCRPPQQFGGITTRLFFEVVHYRVEVLERLRQCVAGRRNVGIVPAEEWQVDRAKKLEGRIGLLLHLRDRIS